LHGTWEPVPRMRREKSKWEVPIRMRVPKRSAGAEQPVLGAEGSVMELEPKGLRCSALARGQPAMGGTPWIRAKPFDIPKREVWEAYKRLESQQGVTAGVDGQSIADFEADLSNNLYKLWNRMSSGSYYPPPVRRVDIPKGDGRTRPLGIPTVADRVAQTVVKRFLERSWSLNFHDDSYGYRPNKSGARCGWEGAAAMLAPSVGS